MLEENQTQIKRIESLERKIKYLTMGIFVVFFVGGLIFYRHFSFLDNKNIRVSELTIVDKENNERIKLYVKDGIAYFSIHAENPESRIEMSTLGIGGSHINLIDYSRPFFKEVQMGTESGSIYFHENGILRASYGKNEYFIADEKGSYRIHSSIDDGFGQPYLKLDGIGGTALQDVLENEKLGKQTKKASIDIGFRENAQPFIDLEKTESSTLTLGSTSIKNVNTDVISKKPTGSITIFTKDGKVLWDVP